MEDYRELLVKNWTFGELQHTKFGLEFQQFKRCLKINIHLIEMLLLSVRPSCFSVRTHILVMDIQIVWILWVRPVMKYGKLTKGALWSHLPPTTDQVGKLSVACKDLRKALLWNPGRSLKDWVPLKWPNSAYNGIKPNTDNRQ